MKELTPENQECQLEKEIFDVWGKMWLESALPFQKENKGEVLFPAGPSADVIDLENGHSNYSPDSILCPTLLIRGEWDTLPSWEDAQKLFNSLSHARYKRYVVINKGTHVLHMEKNRFQLYNEVRNFLSESF